MWHLAYIFAMQLLLLCSVYVIYFQSNVSRGLEPQQMLIKPAPADRLIVFLIDGLSVKSFFENRCSNVQELSNIFLSQGQVGIVHTMEYTQSNSVKQTMLSGIYKNPSNAFDNWMWNDADTLFNRSTFSYVWGSADDLKSLTINGAKNIITTTTKDFQVFDAVNSFLNSESQRLKNVNGQLLVAHLSGLPKAIGKKIYRDQLNFIQHGIWRTYQRFEHTFPNKRTAYLLLSFPNTKVIRGLTDGHSKESIESPFVVWGAGVSSKQSTLGRTFVAGNEMKRLPLNVLEAIQLAPLISTLVGMPPPVGNRGQLPVDLLNASDAFVSNALFNNALQLVTLAKHKLEQHSRGLLFSYLNGHWMNLQNLDKFVYSGNLLWLQKRFVTLKEYSSNIMPVLLQCIEYYDNYYRRVLRLAAALGYLGWQHHLRCHFPVSLRTDTKGNPQLMVAKMLIHLIILVIIMFEVLQRVPWIVCGFLLLPGCIWKLALKAHDKSAKLFPYMPLLWSLCSLTGFSDRRYIALCYIGFSFFQNWTVIRTRTRGAYMWMVLVCALTSISWLPPSLGYYHRGFFTVSVLLTLVRPMAFVRQRSPNKMNLVCNGSATLLAIMHVWCSARPRFLHLISRAYVSYVFYPRCGQQVVETVIYNLSTLYALMSTSYEAAVIQLLALELQLALRMKNRINRQQTIATYILMYIFYSFFIIGDVADIDKFHLLMEIPEFGYYSTFINSLVIAMKLCVPMLLMLCVIWSNCETLWTDRRDIFYSILAICNGMAVICLFRLRDSGTLWEIMDRFIPFVSVQILPFILLLLIRLANLLLSAKSTQPLEIPKWNVL